MLALAAFATPAFADVQVPLDRTDPAVAAREAPRLSTPVPATPAAPLSTAATPANGSAAPTALIVQSIRIEGAEHVPPAELDAVTASFIGHKLSRDDMQDLLAAVSGLARARGYIFARSSVPPQSMAGGVLTVRLDEGRVDEIRLTGRQDAAVREVLSPLIGHAPTRAEVERRLMLAADLPGVATGQVRFAREGETGVLIVPVSRDRVEGRVWLDNRGSSELGPARMQLAADLNGLIDGRDQLTLSTFVTPLQPRELNVVSARYAYQVNDSGTELAAFGSVARTRSGGYWRRYDANGRSTSAGLSVSQVLLRSRKASVWLGGELDYFAIDQHFSGELVRRDRLATANLSVTGYMPLAEGRLRAGLGVSQGLKVLGATASGDPLASRPDADGRFTLYSGWASWTGGIVGPFSAKLAVSGQLATRPLLAVQQISVGGPTFGRGYDYSERSGDQGVLASAELQAKLRERSRGLIRSAQLYVFADAGKVRNLRNSYGTGTLQSAGLGARLTLHSVKLGLEAGFPINADRYETGNRKPRLSVSLASSF